MTAPLPAVVDHLWQSTLFAGMVWLVTLALRSNGARVRYWLWTAASLKFLVPVSALISLGALFRWRTVPAITQPAVSFVIEEVLTPAAVVTNVMAAPASVTPAFVPWLVLAAWAAGTACVIASWRRHWLPIRDALRNATPIILDAQAGAAGLVVMSAPSMLEPGVIGFRRPVLLLPDGRGSRTVPRPLPRQSAGGGAHARRSGVLVPPDALVDRNADD
jgi:hypothetical protein